MGDGLWSNRVGKEGVWQTDVLPGIGAWAPRTVANLSECDCDIDWREENQVSPDGEQVAAVVKTGDAEFGVCVNGTCWNPGMSGFGICAIRLMGV